MTRATCGSRATNWPPLVYSYVRCRRVVVAKILPQTKLYYHHVSEKIMAVVFYYDEPSLRLKSFGKIVPEQSQCIHMSKWNSYALFQS
jgi:hypothetical protein